MQIGLGCRFRSLPTQPLRATTPAARPSPRSAGCQHRPRCPDPWRGRSADGARCAPRRQPPRSPSSAARPATPAGSRRDQRHFLPAAGRSPQREQQQHADRKLLPERSFVAERGRQPGERIAHSAAAEPARAAAALEAGEARHGLATDGGSRISARQQCRTSLARDPEGPLKTAVFRQGRAASGRLQFGMAQSSDVRAPTRPPCRPASSRAPRGALRDPCKRRAGARGCEPVLGVRGEPAVLPRRPRRPRARRAGDLGLRTRARGAAGRVARAAARAGRQPMDVQAVAGGADGRYRARGALHADLGRLSRSVDAAQRVHTDVAEARELLDAALARDLLLYAALPLALLSRVRLVRRPCGRAALVRAAMLWPPAPRARSRRCCRCSSRSRR